MATNKKSFLLYCDLIHTVEQMPDENAGMLFKTILSYVNYRNPDPTDLLTKVSFEPIKQQLIRDLEKYKEICNRNKNNGLKGGRPKPKRTQKTQSVILGTQNNPDKPDTDNDTDTDSDKGIDKEKIDYNALMLFWNENRGNLPKIETINVERKKHIKARISEFSKEKFASAIIKTKQSDYLQGKVNKWKASFDWIINPSNFIKVIEGNYDNDKEQPKATTNTGCLR